MQAHKKLENFFLDKALQSTEANPFSHTVSILKKKPKLTDQIPIPDEKSTRCQSIWFVKTPEDLSLAQQEVLAGEFFRLLNSNHPKYRLGQASDNSIRVLSKGVPDFKSFKSLNDDTTINARINDGTYKGLGDVAVVSLLLQEIDLNLGNVGVNQNNEIIKIDCDWCVRNPSYLKTEITEKVISQLPFPGTYSAYHWFDATRFAVNKAKTTLLDAKMPFNPRIRAEINGALLRAIVLPPNLTEIFINQYIPPTDALNNKLQILMRDRMNQMRQAALANDSFKEYLKTEAAQQQLNTFINYLKTFKTTGKNYLLKACPGDTEDRIRDEFAQMRNRVGYRPPQTVSVVSVANPVPLHTVTTILDLKPLPTQQPTQPGFFAKFKKGITRGCIVGLSVSLLAVITIIALRVADVLTFGISLPITIPATLGIIAGSGLCGGLLGASIQACSTKPVDTISPTRVSLIPADQMNSATTTAVAALNSAVRMHTTTISLNNNTTSYAPIIRTQP